MEVLDVVIRYTKYVNPPHHEGQYKPRIGVMNVGVKIRR